MSQLALSATNVLIEQNIFIWQYFCRSYICFNLKLSHDKAVYHD